MGCDRVVARDRWNLCVTESLCHLCHTHLLSTHVLLLLFQRWEKVQGCWQCVLVVLMR